MISRALEKQILEFVALLESQLAVLIHTGHQKTKHLSKQERATVLENALVIAWRRREHFDPLNEPITSWFERCLFIAKNETVELDSEDLAMLDFLSPATEPDANPIVAAAVVREAVDASLKAGKECPPCWRCRYFDGWLPRKWPYSEDWKPVNDMDLVCHAIDERKVEIAHYVRGEYPAELLED